VAVFSLSLGIGANTAIFTLIQQIILQLLPVRNRPSSSCCSPPAAPTTACNTGGNAISYPMYQDFARQKPGLSVNVLQVWILRESVRQRPPPNSSPVSWFPRNYFPVLGAGAAIGRVFNAIGRSHAERPPARVLSYGFWKRGSMETPASSAAASS